MAGYRREPKQYHLTFEDPEMAGFECVIGTVSVEQFLRIGELASEAQDNATAASQELLHSFADALVSWNLEDSHGPVPATYDGVVKQELDFILQIILAWQQALAGVSPPLSDASGSGETSPEASLRLASLSQSLAS